MEKSIKVRVTCPIRPFPGFWSGGRCWPIGTTDADLPESIVLTMLGEVERGESLLKVELIADAPVVSAPVKSPEKRKV